MITLSEMGTVDTAESFHLPNGDSQDVCGVSLLKPPIYNPLNDTRAIQLPLAHRDQSHLLLVARSDRTFLVGSKGTFERGAYNHTSDNIYYVNYVTFFSGPGFLKTWFVMLEHGHRARACCKHAQLTFPSLLRRAYPTKSGLPGMSVPDLAGDLLLHGSWTATEARRYALKELVRDFGEYFTGSKPCMTYPDLHPVRTIEDLGTA